MMDSNGFHYNYNKNGHRTMQAAHAIVKFEDQQILFVYLLG